MTSSRRHDVIVGRMRRRRRRLDELSAGAVVAGREQSAAVRGRAGRALSQRPRLEAVAPLPEDARAVRRGRGCVAVSRPAAHQRRRQATAARRLRHQDRALPRRPASASRRLPYENRALPSASRRLRHQNRSLPRRPASASGQLCHPHRLLPPRRKGRQTGRSVLFRSLAVLEPTVGHTMDVLSPFISVLCHSD